MALRFLRVQQPAMEMAVIWQLLSEFIAFPSWLSVDIHSLCTLQTICTIPHSLPSCASLHTGTKGQGRIA